MNPRTLLRAIIFVAAAGSLVEYGFGQGRGAGGAAPSSGSAGAPGSIGGTPSTGPNNTPSMGIPTNPGNNPSTGSQTGVPRVIPISGRVLMEDGQPPTDLALIERVCGASTRAEGYTDSKGYFFFQLDDRNSGVLQDASEMSSGMGSMSPTRNPMGNPGFGGSSGGARGMDTGEMRYANCELRAKLPGFRSQTVSLANHRALDSPDIGTILLHRLAPGSGNTVSTNDLEVPKEARKAFDKGQEAAKKGKLNDALKDYSKAVELYRSYAAAWYQLGRLQAGGGDAYTARGSFGEAIKADPKYVPPYLAIAEQDVEAKKWRDVAEITDRASKLDVFDYPQVYFFNAVANYNLKNLDAAEKSIVQAERLDTRHRYPQIYFLLRDGQVGRHILGVRFDGLAEGTACRIRIAPARL